MILFLNLLDLCVNTQKAHTRKTRPFQSSGGVVGGWVISQFSNAHLIASSQVSKA